MTALGKFGDARAIRPLIACLDADSDVRYNAGEAALQLGETLCKSGDRRGVDVLIACITAHRTDLEDSAAAILKKVGPTDVRDLGRKLVDQKRARKEQLLRKTLGLSQNAEVGYMANKDMIIDLAEILPSLRSHTESELYAYMHSLARQDSGAWGGGRVIFRSPSAEEIIRVFIRESAHGNWGHPKKISDVVHSFVGWTMHQSSELHILKVSSEGADCFVIVREDKETT